MKPMDIIATYRALRTRVLASSAFSPAATGINRPNKRLKMMMKTYFISPYLKILEILYLPNMKAR